MINIALRSIELQTTMHMRLEDKIYLTSYGCNYHYIEPLKPEHAARRSQLVTATSRCSRQMSSWSFLTISTKTLSALSPCFTPESKIGDRVPDYHIVIVPCYVDGGCNLNPSSCPVCKSPNDGIPSNDENILPSPKETENVLTTPGKDMITRHEGNDETSNSGKLSNTKQHIEALEETEKNSSAVKEDLTSIKASENELQREFTANELTAPIDGHLQTKAKYQNNAPESKDTGSATKEAGENHTTTEESSYSADTSEMKVTQLDSTTEANVNCNLHGNSRLVKRALFLTDKHSVAIIDGQKSGKVYIEWLKMCKCSAISSNSTKGALRNRAKLLQIIDLIVEAKLAAPKELIITFVNKLKGADAVNFELEHLGLLNETTRELTVTAKKKIIINSLITNSESLATSIINPALNVEADKSTVNSSIKEKIPPLLTTDEELSPSESDTDELTKEDERRKKKKPGCTKMKRKSVLTAKMLLKVKEPHSKLNKCKKLKGFARKADGTILEGKTEKAKKKPKTKIKSAEIERPSPIVESKLEKANAARKDQPEETVSALKLTVTALELPIKTLEKNLLELQDRLSQQELALEALTKKPQVSLTPREAVNNKTIKNLEGKNKLIFDTLNVQQNTIDNLIDELSKSKKENKKLHEKFSNAQGVNKSLQEQVKQLSEVTNQIDVLRESNTHLVNELGDMRNEIELLREKTCECSKMAPNSRLTTDKAEITSQNAIILALREMRQENAQQFAYIHDLIRENQARSSSRANNQQVHLATTKENNELSCTPPD